MHLTIDTNNPVISIVGKRGSGRVSIAHDLVQKHLDTFHTVLLFSATEDKSQVYSKLLSNVFIHVNLDEQMCSHILESCRLREKHLEKMLIIIQDQDSNWGTCIQWRKLFEFANQNPSLLNILCVTDYVHHIESLTNYIQGCVFCNQHVESTRHFLSSFFHLDMKNSSEYAETFITRYHKFQGNTVWFNRSAELHPYPSLFTPHVLSSYKTIPDFSVWNVQYQGKVKNVLHMLYAEGNLSMVFDVISLVTQYVNGEEFYLWKNILHI